MTVSRSLLAMTVALTGLTIGATGASAQGSTRPPLRNGFSIRLDAESTNAEILRQDQLYVMEVTFKPMRMRWVSLTDPKTGVKKREVIWYLVYKAVNRPLDRRVDQSDTKPKNTEDKIPPILFVPEFTLVTTDGDRRKIYPDTIIPQALADIVKRESKPHRKLTLKDSVGNVGPVPAVTAETAATENAVFGVAMWRGIDPETDFFTVYIGGFSNAFKTVGGISYQKTIVQKYQRPGDRFFLTETEISRDGDPKWIYWPEDIAASVEKPTAKQPVVPPKKQP